MRVQCSLCTGIMYISLGLLIIAYLHPAQRVCTSVLSIAHLTFILMSFYDVLRLSVVKSMIF